MWKSQIPHQHAVFCAHRADIERRVSISLNTEFASSCSCTDKYMQNYVKIYILESILDKTVGNVLSESKQLRNKSDVHHYTGCIAS